MVQRTTRDTSFNFSVDVDGTLLSAMSYNMTNNINKARLLNFEDGIAVTGQKIKSHAENNKTMDELGYEGLHINTDNILDDNTYRIYGTPFQVVLNNRQHFNNCGVESTLNTLATAGQIKMNENLSDQRKVEKDFLTALWNMGLADDEGIIGELDEPDGGTTPEDYKDMFVNFDIDSEAYFITPRCDGTQYENINELAYKISQGYGAVLGVCSNKLWQEQVSETGEIAIDHAVAIIGVVYDEGVTPAQTNIEGEIIGYNEPVGFYIHDSGAWMTRYISLDEFKEVTLYDYQGMYYDGMTDAEKAEYFNYDPTADYDAEKYLPDLRLYDTENRGYLGKQPGGIFVTITNEPIKTDMFNLSITGNNYANEISGNNSNNIIKGLAGNDILYGNSGDDELYGGKGNDIIIGNNLYADNIVDYKAHLETTYGLDLSNVRTSANNTTGDNLIYGEAGNDIIIGGNGYNLIYGGSGNDFVWLGGGDGRNAVYGEAGNDTIIGGSNRDRLFGDAGNDTIHGYGDDDLINGGAGNDCIFGGKGDDRIETGAGNDTVYFEGTEHGSDDVTALGGTTTFRFVDDQVDDAAKVSDMYFSLSRDDDNNRLYDFQITYTDDEEKSHDNITFSEFYNSKTNRSKLLNIVEEGDEGDVTYRVSASRAATIRLNSRMNNISFSLRDKGATIITGNGNDIVTMVESDSADTDYLSRVDKITYNGGKDMYISEEGNTYYTVNGFGENTSLLIYDNVEALTKKVSDGEQYIEIDDIVSYDDKLYLSSAKDNLKLFFDVGISNFGDEYDILVTDNAGLFVFDGASFESDKFVSVANDDDSVTGLVYMDSFFGDDKKFTDEDFYGNGRIESIYFKNNRNYEQYSNNELTGNIFAIAQAVAGWLAADSGYTSAYEAFADENLSPEALAVLVDCYNPNVV